ncbi:hypothetical protein [Vibrio maerlii]|uniref:hypothetical protein n=1 Tax=Vibrio maerlii TaxID=2231648 RepID=UPI000E3D10A8|nr:hypothetical protein [Vibrio maerlii]
MYPTVTLNFATKVQPVSCALLHEELNWMVQQSLKKLGQKIDVNIEYDLSADNEYQQTRIILSESEHELQITEQDTKADLTNQIIALIVR